MTIIFNFIIAGLLLCTGIYQLWNGNWTEALTLFALTLILRNAAGGYQAAQNSVIIYKVIAHMKVKVETIDQRTKFIRNHLLEKDE